MNANKERTKDQQERRDRNIMCGRIYIRIEL